MTNFTSFETNTKRYDDVPLVREFKQPSAIIVLGSALGGFSLYALAVTGMIVYDIALKLFS